MKDHRLTRHAKSASNYDTDLEREPFTRLSSSQRDYENESIAGDTGDQDGSEEQTFQNEIQLVHEQIYESSSKQQRTFCNKTLSQVIDQILPTVRSVIMKK